MNHPAEIAGHGLIADCGDIHEKLDEFISKPENEDAHVQADPHEDDMEESSLDDIVAHADDNLATEETLPVRATSLIDQNQTGNGDDSDSGSDEVEEVEDRVGGSDGHSIAFGDINATSANNATGEHWVESDCKHSSEENGGEPESTTIVRESVEGDDDEKEEAVVKAEDHLDDDDDGDYEVPKKLLTEETIIDALNEEVPQDRDSTEVLTAKTNGDAHHFACDMCGEKIVPDEGGGGIFVFDSHFHNDCLKCTQCDCHLTDGKAHVFENTIYCEEHHKERLPLNRNDDLIKHTYSENYTKEEMPSPQITKNLVAKFQQGGDPEQQPPRRSVSPNSTPNKPGKLGDWVPESQEETEVPRPDEVLPPEGSAKRLVQQWTNINAGDDISKPPKPSAEESHYAPNTAKTIAAKFAAGIAESPNSQPTGSEEPDHQRPSQGQARGLIAKFSAMQS